jgi:hypothetical protein
MSIERGALAAVINKALLRNGVQLTGAELYPVTDDVLVFLQGTEEPAPEVAAPPPTPVLPETPPVVPETPPVPPAEPVEPATPTEEPAKNV